MGFKFSRPYLIFYRVISAPTLKNRLCTYSCHINAFLNHFKVYFMDNEGSRVHFFFRYQNSISGTHFYLRAGINHNHNHVAIELLLSIFCIFVCYIRPFLHHNKFCMYLFSSMLAISHFNIFDRGKCHARGRVSLLLSAALSTTSHFGYFTSIHFM